MARENARSRCPIHCTWAAGDEIPGRLDVDVVDEWGSWAGVINWRGRRFSVRRPNNFIRRAANEREQMFSTNSAGLLPVEFAQDSNYKVRLVGADHAAACRSGRWR